MASAPNIDGVLIQWGDRLFYPGNRMVKGRPEPRLRAGSDLQRAAAIRARIAATVVRRAPQVMVKVTGGGRGMKATSARTAGSTSRTSAVRSSTARTRCRRWPMTGALAAPQSMMSVTGARPSISCCRCRAASIR